MPPLKSYGSDLSYSYAPGVFPALELMKNAPQRARRLLLSERRRLKCGARACRGRQRQLGDDCFNGYVACGIPARGVHVRVGEGVQKHVVQHDMQVRARKLLRA